MKKIFRGVTVVSVAMLFMAGSLMSAHAAPITVRAVSAWAKSAQFETQQFLEFIETIQKEANQKYPGQLVIDYKGAGEVIPTQQQIEALRSGLVDMILTAASYYTSIMPEMDVMSLTTMMPWEERKAGVNDYLEKLHNTKANAHYLARMGSGDLFHVFLAKPVQKIDDFKGMKIRVSPTHIPFMKSLGVEPVVTPPSEIYTAMERAVVAGYIQPVASIRTWGCSHHKIYAAPGVLSTDRSRFGEPRFLEQAARLFEEASDGEYGEGRTHRDGEHCKKDQV